MCVRIRYKDGSKKKFDPSKNMEDQIKNVDFLEIEGHTTKKEREMVLSLLIKEIEKNHEKIENKFQEIQVSLKGNKK